MVIVPWHGPKLLFNSSWMEPFTEILHVTDIFVWLSHFGLRFSKASWSNHHDNHGREREREIDRERGVFKDEC